MRHAFFLKKEGQDPCLLGERMSVGDGDGIMAMLTYRTVELDAWTAIVTIITLYGLPQGGLLPILGHS